MFRFLNVPGAVAVLAPTALILASWAPMVVLPTLVQVSERCECKLIYKVPILGKLYETEDTYG